MYRSVHFCVSIVNRSVHVNLYLFQRVLETMNTAPRKEHLLNIAFELFNSGGFVNVGIDKIIEVSGVSKATLYKHFESKEDLILEILKRKSKNWIQSLELQITKSKSDYPNKPLHYHIYSLVDLYEQRIKKPDFYGCNFIKAGTEFVEKKEPIHTFAIEHKKKVELIFLNLLEGVERSKAKTLARQILLILDGALVSAAVLDNKKSINDARAIISLLLQDI